MNQTAFELLSLGMRYVFVILILLTLLRAFWLILMDRRDYKQTLRHLPDAGLVGEVVDLHTGKTQALPKEGLLGSGRSCDIRLPGLRRREMEFIFKPGMGIKLIPLHKNHQADLDGEPLNKADSFALHGTTLALRNQNIRFRLFAGLDLPSRQLITNVDEPTDFNDDAEDAWDTSGYNNFHGVNEPYSQDFGMTWQYAPLPPEALVPPETNDQAPPIRQRRSRRNKPSTEEHPDE